MEEAKADESSRTQFTTMPTSSITTQDPHSHNNKRKLRNADIYDSSYFKIRAIVHQLRPHFIQVLRTPDFRNCKAAHEIQKQMKLVMDLCKQMTMETDPKCKNVPEHQPLSDDSILGKERTDEHQDGKQPELLQPKRVLEKSAEKKPPLHPFSSEKTPGAGWVQGSYIVGGSVFGWNFITFGGSKPVYYGVTKESHQSSYRKSEYGNLPFMTVDNSTDKKHPIE